MVAKVTRAPPWIRRLASWRVGLIWPWAAQDMRRKWWLFMFMVLFVSLSIV